MNSTNFYETLPSHGAVASNLEFDWYNGRQVILFLGTGILTFGFYLLSAVWAFIFDVKAPVVGHRSKWEPGWLVGFRFVRGSGPMIQSGYEKFKNSMFKIQRNDAKILVISHKHVNQLRNMPEEKISAIRAHLKNLLGRYSTTSVLLESDLHTRTLQQKLTPQLGTTIPSIKDELDYAMDVEIPKGCDKEWTAVHINEILLRIVARISARIFVGPELCRNEEWLTTSIKYTENIFATVITLRAMPAFLHPVIAPLLPSYWRIHSNLNTAKRIIGPMVVQRRAAAENDPDYQKPVDFLQWMMDIANSQESHPHKLAHRQLLISLASIHTTTMSAAHAIYDLCAYPEYFEPLRQELVDVLRADGGFKKTTLSNLRKMDSFLKESQRINPPSLLAFNRIVREPLTLSDGTKLPTGTHFSMASDAILHDAAYLPGGGDPAAFDPFRYYRLRTATAENATRYQFATTESTSLHFGHGKYACPGRFFASNEIKVILAHMLLRYEFKYPEGHGRPQNFYADENIYPDPTATVLMCKRDVSDAAVAELVGA